MIIEIRKAGFVNKGAELMLHAVLQKVKEAYPDATYVMAPEPRGGSVHFQKMTSLGFYPKAWLWFLGIQWGDIAALIPKRLRNMYGIILDRDIDIVLDAAGFQYSDQWGTKQAAELAHSSKRWKKNGTKVILLPQALGPFDNLENQKTITKAIQNIDLIFPRERISYNHLTKLVGESKKIIQSPDFTNIVKGEIPENFDRQNNRFCIVPNCRMIDKTSKEISEAYLPFLIKCTRYLIQKGAKPFILIHEGADDLAIAEKISKAVGGVPIISEDNPVKIKGILSVCSGTLGSRFHGLVSALSQGVPSLATGWSHKYQMLFEDYGFPEGIVDMLAEDSVTQNQLDLIINPETNKTIQRTIQEKSEILKGQTEDMWRTVFSELKNS